MDRSKRRDELPWHERYNCEGNHRWPRSGFTYKCVGANGVRYETACNDCLAIHVVFEVTDLAGNITRGEAGTLDKSAMIDKRAARENF